MFQYLLLQYDVYNLLRHHDDFHHLESFKIFSRALIVEYGLLDLVVGGIGGKLLLITGFAVICPKLVKNVRN